MNLRDLWPWWRTSRRNREESTATPNTPVNQPTISDTGDGNEDNAGLKVLYNPTERNLKPEVDIVGIHGLGGHREKSWTAREPETGSTVLWLKDFLPEKLPHARIMTYGYSSEVLSVKQLTQRTLYSQSKTLLEALKRSRRDTDATNRPIIFIAHSLGGLVVKSALIHADRNDHIFNDLRVCTAGVVFLGTPHQGTPNNSWIRIVTDLISPKIDLDRMRNTLDSDLDWLQFQLEQYKSLDGSFPTYCLYEDETFQKISGASTVVPRVSATPLELLTTTTLSTAPRRQLHENLCKFLGRDSEYKETVSQLIAMCQGSGDLVSRNLLLDRLRREVVDNESEPFFISTSLSQSRADPFLGRDTQLETIQRCLQGQNQHLITLYGTAGVGKTQIAVEYAYTYKNNYSSIIWLDAQNRFALHSSLLKFAVQLKNHYVGTSRKEERLEALHRLYLGGLVDEEGQVQSCQDHPELLSLVFRKWLERRGNDRWLLIIDGVNREPDLREFHIDEFLDSPIKGHIIITSRSFRRGETLYVPGLEPDHAVTLLRQTTDLGEIPYNDTRELVDRLGRLPLAIKQASAFLSSSKWSINKYLEDISLTPPPSSIIEIPSSLTNAWLISIQQLDEKTSELLDRIAFLSDNDISIELVKNGLQESACFTPGFPLDSSMAEPIDDLIYESLTTLRKLFLVRYDSATRTVALDSYMPEWLRESKERTSEYSSRAKMACWSVSSYLKSATADINSVTYTAKHYHLEEQLLPYMERCVNYVRVLSPDEADWEFLGDTCRRQGRHDLAKNFYEKLVRDYQQIPLRAEILLRDLHDMEHSLGPAHIRTLGCATLLASRYQEEGVHAKAEIIWRRVNSSQSKALGNFHPLTLKTAERLAITLKQQGKYGEAKAIYSSTCNATATVLGEGHADCLRLMTDVAVLYTLERRFDEADQEYRKVLKKLEEKLGQDHEDVKRIQRYIALNNKHRRPGIEADSEGLHIDS
ncbi:hypothetical protein F5X98DRAFT_373996 [Xylaria grammica]|nr:hypothetical protein F5X98DRAFT_373996 [Xylaria grammica]